MDLFLLAANYSQDDILHIEHSTNVSLQHVQLDRLLPLEVHINYIAHRAVANNMYIINYL